MQGRILARFLCHADQPRARELVGARERIQPVANCLGHILRRARGTRAQRHHPARDGEQVLDAVAHLSEQKVLLFLGSPELGDVPGDFRRPDDPALGILDGRHGQRNLDQSSVLAPTNGFIMIDALAATDAVDNRGFLVEAVRRNHDRDRFADDLFGRIAEQPRRAPVPTGDDAVEVLAHDRVIGALDNRGEQPPIMLRALALGDVDQHVHRADHCAGFVDQR